MTEDANNMEQKLKYILQTVAESENISNYDIIIDKIRIQGEGFMSEFFNGEVLNKDNGKTEKVAIKNAPTGGFLLKDFTYEPIYKNELHFYSKVFPELDKFQRAKAVKYPFSQIPRYFSGNADSEYMFIAMENLKTTGYELFDKKKYLDSEHLELIFKTYGKFHALSFTFKQENLEEYNSLTVNLTNIFEKLIDSDEFMVIMDNAFSGARNTFDPVTEADKIEKINRYQDIKTVIKNVKFYKGSYNCLTHGDCWSNNMLFKYKGSGELEDMKLIDFQLVVSSTPVHDLSYFFYAGAAKKDMDKLDYYLDLYYESFSNFVKELGGEPDVIFPMEVLKKEWKEYAILGVFLGCQLWLNKLIDKEEIIEMLNRKGLSAENFFDMWNIKMDEIRNGEVYREIARNICLHAIEYGIM